MANYITEEGMRYLIKKMQQLVKERPAIIKQVATAREMGDLSENAEYHAARERQQHLENEYNYIKNRIEKLQVVDTDKIPKDAVRFGAKVIAKELSSQEKKYIYLVGIDEIFESDDSYKRISVLSPIGKAMIAKKIGDHYTVKAPIGDREFVIIDIK